jgi:hypothetical protein
MSADVIVMDRSVVDILRLRRVLTTCYAESNLPLSNTGLLDQWTERD